MEESNTSAGECKPQSRERNSLGGVGGGTIIAALKSGFVDLGRLDPRSLALFRIMLGGLIVLDVALRLVDLRAFYTDFGVLSRTVLIEKHNPVARFSFLMSSGAAWFQTIIFLLTAASGACLAAGYRTRIFAVASWLLLLSIQNRNPLIIQGGDVLFRIMVLFSAVLPVSCVWSVDARSRPAHHPRPSFLHFAYVAQVACVYIVTGTAKYKNVEWRDGLGLPYVFWLQQYTTWLGDLLGALPITVLQAMTAGVLAGEIILPLFLFLPWQVSRIRMISCVIAFGFHLTILMTIKVGLFCLISIIAWLPLLPTSFWEILPSKLNNRVGRFLLETRLSPTSVSVSSWRRMCKEWIGLMFLAFLVVWNTGNIFPSVRSALRPDWFAQTALFWGIDQSWEMFSKPIKSDGWFMIPAVRADGSLVDLFSGREYTGPSRPDSLSAAFPGDRWRKYWRNLLRKDRSYQRLGLGGYLCRRSMQDRNPGRYIEAFQIILMQESIGTDGSHSAPKKVLLWSHQCKPGLLKKWEKKLPFANIQMN